MAKLVFHYGVMSAGKSQALLQVNHHYQCQGRDALILKPMVDSRDGAEFVVSRLGIRAPALPVSSADNLEDVVAGASQDKNLSIVLVDEAQFFSPRQIRELANVADKMGIPVLAYGLRTDSFGNLFPGSRALFELADELKELDQICFCGRKARMNLRFDVSGFVVREGNSIHIGDAEYRSVCRAHWNTIEHIDETFVEDLAEALYAN